jgi:hypothetical protein
VVETPSCAFVGLQGLDFDNDVKVKCKGSSKASLRGLKKNDWGLQIEMHMYINTYIHTLFTFFF